MIATVAAESASPALKLEAEEQRRAFIMSHVPASRPGLEIAPSLHPVTDRAKHDVLYVDCIHDDKIRRKAAPNPGAAQRDIPGADAVWVRGRRLAEFVQGRRFGYAIASHVLERVPNPLGWLQEILECVDVGGRIAILLPHKCFTMDSYRPLTTFAQVVGWSVQKPVRPTAAQVMESLSQASFDDGSVSFDGSPPPFGRAPRRHSDQQALDFARRVHDTDDALDVRCTVWTPESFVDVFGRVRRLGLLDAEIRGPFTGFAGSPHAEFLVCLEKTAAAT